MGESSGAHLRSGRALCQWRSAGTGASAEVRLELRDDVAWGVSHGAFLVSLPQSRTAAWAKAWCRVAWCVSRVSALGEGEWNEACAPLSSVSKEASKANEGVSKKAFKANGGVSAEYTKKHHEKIKLSQQNSKKKWICAYAPVTDRKRIVLAFFFFWCRQNVNALMVVWIIESGFTSLFFARFLPVLHLSKLCVLRFPP